MNAACWRDWRALYGAGGLGGSFFKAPPLRCFDPNSSSTLRSLLAEGHGVHAASSWWAGAEKLGPAC